MNDIKKSFEVVNAVIIALLALLPALLFFLLPVVVLMFFIIGAVEIGGVFYYLLGIPALYVFGVVYIACCFKVVSVVESWLDRE